MLIKLKKKPRTYIVGAKNHIKINDLGKIKLKENEQISFQSKLGLYDFCKKNWGYYSTPSVNKRLRLNNFQVYLVKNIYDNIFVWTVEKNKYEEFCKYLNDENHTIITRLDRITSNDILIDNFKKALFKMNQSCKGINQCRKNNKNIKTVYKYIFAPKREPNYKIQNYKRSVVQCKKCLHFFAKHLINTKKLYYKDYSKISHGNDIEKKFNKINLLKSKSDNFNRVNRVVNFFKKKYLNKKISLLDIGSGMGIFLYNIKKKVKWKLSGLEPDRNFFNFCKKKLNLTILNKNFHAKHFKTKFNVITLNKVIEHVKNPELFLKDVYKVLSKKGFIYIEVPDGVSSSQDKLGKNREEFFLDHLHIFSIFSLKNCLDVCGFKVIEIKNIIEASGKYTIYAFAQKQT